MPSRIVQAGRVLVVVARLVVVPYCGMVWCGAWNDERMTSCWIVFLPRFALLFAALLALRSQSTINQTQTSTIWYARCRPQSEFKFIGIKLAVIPQICGYSESWPNMATESP